MRMKLGILLGAILPACSAHAALIVDAWAGLGFYHSSGLATASTEDYPGAKSLRAFMFSSGNGDAGPGVLTPCGTDCASVPHGWGRAEANGENGRLKAGGGGNVTGNYSGGGQAQIHDSILFSPGATIELSLSGYLNASRQGTDLSEAQMGFLILFSRNPDVDEVLFAISAQDTAYGRGYSVFGAANQEDGDYGFIPDTFDFIIDTSAWTDVIGVPASSQSLPLKFLLYAQGGCSGSGCFAVANYGNTAYLKFNGEYVSASGYNYSGAPPDSAIPEPRAWTLAALGLTAVGLLRRRRV